MNSPARTLHATPSVLASVLILSLAPAVTGQILSFDDLHLSIPDGSLSGRTDTRTVSGLTGVLMDVNVSLEITPLVAGAFNGDLLVTLVHDSGYAVLLNRPGRRTLDPVGYLDGGLSITLDDQAGNGDIHVYRHTLSGSHSIGLVGSLTGPWASDARESDPTTVLETDPRTAGLDAFQGLDPNGTWTLFVADLIGGGTPMQLNGWGLDLTVVPEPSASAWLAGLSLAGIALWRCRRR